MKILVTGGAGFIGSHVVDRLILDGYKVVVIDNLSAGKLENLNSNSFFYKADITDFDSLKKIFKEHNFDAVIHLAAQIDVRRSVSDPQFDAKVNIIGSLNLLELSIKNNVKKFIFASSGGTIYGDCKGLSAPNEKSPSRPESPYGCAKLSVEYYLNYYTLLYGLKTVSLRYANVYGPRQDPFGEAGVVAIFANRMLKGEQVNIFGDGEQKRDFVYVKDVVEANIKCLTLDNFNNLVLNIGTGKLTSINNLFQEMASLLSYKQKPVYKELRAGELFESYLDYSLAKETINWLPTTDLLGGLKYTLEYFRTKLV